MTAKQDDTLVNVEAQLRKRFLQKDPLVEEALTSQDREAAKRRSLPSTAKDRKNDQRLAAIVLPDEKRARLPMTKEKFLVKESPQLVFWERETRKFLRQLSPEHAHRVSAVMVYEWATGLSVKELEAALAEQTDKQAKKASWRSDLRSINKLLKYYYGAAGQVRIAGRTVARAYTVKAGYYIKRHRPMTLELYAEYVEGTLVA